MWLCRVQCDVRKPGNQEDEWEELLPVRGEESDLQVILFCWQCMV